MQRRWGVNFDVLCKLRRVKQLTINSDFQFPTGNVVGREMNHIAKWTTKFMKIRLPLMFNIVLPLSRLVPLVLSHPLLLPRSPLIRRPDLLALSSSSAPFQLSHSWSFSTIACMLIVRMVRWGNARRDCDGAAGTVEYGWTKTKFKAKEN